MVITIETTEDFLRALRGNEDFLAAARREILTQELLALPEKFAAYSERTDQRLDVLTAEVDVLNGKFDVMADDFTDITGKFDVLNGKFDVLNGKFDVLNGKFDVLNGKFDVMTDDFADITGKFDVMTDDFADVKGRIFGSDIARTGLSRMVSRFRVRGTRIVRLAEDNRVSQDFNEAVWDAIDDGALSEYERERLTVTDMIVRCRLGKEPAPEAYIVAEASYRIDNDDIDKVKASADAILKVFPDTTVFACIYCAEISDDLFAIAEQSDVSIFIE